MSDSADHGMDLNEARNLRTLLILERVVQATQPVTISRLAQRLDIPKSTLVRMLNTLETSGFLARSSDQEGYIPGPRSNELALTTLSSNPFTRACRAVLRGLVQELGESCNFVTLDGDQVIHVERVDTAHPLRLHVQPGSRHPLHCTAGGKLFLALMAGPERRELLARMKMTRMTPRTLTTPGVLQDALTKISETRIGIDNEEYIQGMVGVAVPVYGSSGRMSAAIVCHAAAARTQLQELLAHVTSLQAAAKQLSGLVSR